MGLRDQILSSNLEKVSNTAFQVANTVQKMNCTPGEQMAGAAAYAIVFLNESKMTLSELLDIVNKIIKHADGIRPEFKALGDYIRHEMINKKF